MSVQEVLSKAKAQMRGRKQGTWAEYSYFKNLATNGEWIENYDYFISELTKILNL